jgi:hypothetical protein
VRTAPEFPEVRKKKVAINTSPIPKSNLGRFDRLKEMTRNQAIAMATTAYSAESGLLPAAINRLIPEMRPKGIRARQSLAIKNPNVDGNSTSKAAYPHDEGFVLGTINIPKGIIVASRLSTGILLRCVGIKNKATKKSKLIIKAFAIRTVRIEAGISGEANQLITQ